MGVSHMLAYSFPWGWYFFWPLLSRWQMYGFRMTSPTVCHAPLQSLLWDRGSLQLERRGLLLSKEGNLIITSTLLDLFYIPSIFHRSIWHFKNGTIKVLAQYLQLLAGFPCSLVHDFPDCHHSVGDMALHEKPEPVWGSPAKHRWEDWGSQGGEGEKWEHAEKSAKHQPWEPSSASEGVGDHHGEAEGNEFITDGKPAGEGEFLQTVLHHYSLELLFQRGSEDWCILLGWGKTDQVWQWSLYCALGYIKWLCVVTEAFNVTLIVRTDKSGKWGGNLIICAWARPPHLGHQYYSRAVSLSVSSACLCLKWRTTLQVNRGKISTKLFQLFIYIKTYFFKYPDILREYLLFKLFICNINLQIGNSHKQAGKT